MIKNFVFYVLGLYITGMILSGITSAILEFVPYFMAGMTITAPIFGALRQKNNSKYSLKTVILSMKKKMIKLNKKSLTIYFLIFIVTMNTYEQMGEVLVESLKWSVLAFIFTGLLWELVRFFIKKAKRNPFMSFGEAMKGII
jgi:hypothetical protein